MQLLTQAMEELQSCARAAESPFLAVERTGQELELELKTTSGQATTRLLLLRKRSLAFKASLDTQVARTRALLQQPPPVRRSAATGALAALEAEAGARALGFEAAATPLATLAAGLKATLGALRDELSRAIGSVESARAALVETEKRGLTLLEEADALLDALKARLLDQIAQIETPLLEAIDALRAIANLFSDETRALMQTFEQSITGATSPVLAGAGQLKRLVTDLQIQADTLIGQVEKVVSTVTSAIDMIPVDALPEPMAKPAVSALEQVSSQFATQLQAGAKAVSGQLTAVSKQISTAITEGQQQLSQQLDAALTPLFSQIDALVAQIEAKRKDIEAKVQSQLAQLNEQKSQLLASAQQQITALTAPVLDQLAQLRTQIEQAAAEASARAAEAIEACKSQAATLRTQVNDFIERSTRLEASLAAAEAELPAAFAQVLELSKSTP